jgi:hypothetical protein
MYNCSYMHFRRQRVKIKEEMHAQLLVCMFWDLGVWKRLIGDGMGVGMYEWGLWGSLLSLDVPRGLWLSLLDMSRWWWWEGLFWWWLDMLRCCWWP